MNVHVQPTAYFADADLSALIAQIYDAAVTPALWGETLESCRQFVGGMSATIFAKNVTGSRGQV